MSLVVFRHPEGISLNGREYLLDDEGQVKKFSTINEVCGILGIDKMSAIDIEEEYGIFVEDETADPEMNALYGIK